MTNPHADEDPSGRRLAPRASLARSRWGLWLGSLIVAAAASVLVTVAGSGGTAALIPSAIQVGGQASTVTSIVAKSNVPTTTFSTPSTQPVAVPTTPTTIASTHRTTVIDPVSPVTDQKDSGGDGPSDGADTSGGSNTGTTTSTTTTTSATSVTSTSIDN
jgi:hypothetical protein